MILILIKCLTNQFHENVVKIFDIHNLILYLKNVPVMILIPYCLYFPNLYHLYLHVFEKHCEFELNCTC